MHTSSGGPTLRPAARNTAFAALLLGMLMASLDTNIVVAALPSIGTALGYPEEVAGVTAAYLLAVAVATPLHGSLGDRWGRRSMFVASILVFAVGSLACALAPSMWALIGFRVLQGLGGSGLIVAAIAAMAELFSREEMVHRQGWMTAMFAVSSIAGAPLGGLLAADFGWRWIFLINLPICAVAVTLGAKSVPGPRPAGRHSARRLDSAGAALVAITGASIVLLGSSHSLATSPVWAPILLAGTISAAIALVRVERRAHTPLIPPQVFADAGLARSMIATLGSGIALFGSFTFVPLAIIDGTGNHPATTGLLLLPMTLGQLALTSGFAVLARRWPALTGWGRLGLALGAAGMTLLAIVPTLHPGPGRTALTAGALALAGAALGLSMQAYTLIAQSRAPADIVGATIATLTFTRQIGGSAGIALFGWINLLVAGTAGLSTLFIIAAVAIGLALLTAPRATDDPTETPRATERARPQNRP